MTGLPMKPTRIVTILGLTVLAACAAPPVPRDHFYRLDVTPQIGARPAADGPFGTGPTLGIVSVDTFDAEGQLRERALLFSKSETEIQQQDYHFWADPPARMLQNALVDHLRASGAATAVVTPQMRVTPDLQVQARVKRLERRVDDATVLAEIEIALTRPATQELVLIDTYRASQPARDTTVVAAVDAINVAVGDIFARFLVDAAAHQSAGVR